MKSEENVKTNEELVEAIRDLTRVLIINGAFESKSEMVRKLYDSSISPSRIARLLGMKLKDITAIVAKGKSTIKQQSAPKSK